MNRLEKHFKGGQTKGAILPILKVHFRLRTTDDVGNHSRPNVDVKVFVSRLRHVIVSGGLFSNVKGIAVSWDWLHHSMCDKLI